jgi:hypothetical protein
MIQNVKRTVQPALQPAYSSFALLLLRLVVSYVWSSELR